MTLTRSKIINIVNNEYLPSKLLLYRLRRLMVIGRSCATELSVKNFVSFFKKRFMQEFYLFLLMMIVDIGAIHYIYKLFLYLFFAKDKFF